MTDLYGTVFAGAYDGIYGDKDYTRECDLLEQVFGGYGGGPVRSVLDLGCGTGTHALDLAGRGYDVLGVDVSPPMIMEAQRKAAMAPPVGPVAFRLGDLRTCDPGRGFDAVTMLFSVLGYQTTNEAALEALRRARGNLRRGGLLVFDIWFGPAVVRSEPDQRIKRIPTESGEVVRISSGSLDLMRQVCHITFEFWRIEGDQVCDRAIEHHTMRFFFPLELDLLLTTAGFALRKMGSLGRFEGDPDGTDRNVFCVAEAV